MKNGEDFLNFLPRDLSIKILSVLDDPIDLVRVGVVSRSWRHFVITNGLCKHLSLRMFPQLSRVDNVNELAGIAKDHTGAGSSNFTEWEALEREHRVYAFLARQCLLPTIADCIEEAIIASTTDNYPEESIDNTLEPIDGVGWEASYWSCKGQSNPAVAETLTYRLLSDLCVVTEIKIRPFQAYFQVGCPIYSAKFVRFRLGHIKSSQDSHVNESCQDSGNDKFAWTYTSQEFEMAQENRLQTFKFPEPVLCIGGILQIELLSGVQRQETDGLFYICVSRVQVVGRTLHYFGIKILNPSEKFVLEVRRYSPLIIRVPISSVSSLQMRVRDLEHIVNPLQGNGGEYGWWEIDNEEEAGIE